MVKQSENKTTRSKEGNENPEFENALQILGDFDVIWVKSSFFGFFSFKDPQEMEDHSGYEIIKQFTLKLNEYEKISLDNSEVNVHALRTAIHRNLESLRAINITNCRFYLSDEDVHNKFNQIYFLRMFSEINLVWLIKSLKFVNLESIKIILPVYLPETESLKKSQNLKVHPTESNNHDHKYPSFNKKQLIKEFQCEEGCQFLLFEESKRNQSQKYSTEEQLNALQEQLIWDNVQDIDNFFNKLYEEILSDIEQELQIYKKFTKYAFNGIKLLIIGQVLNIPMAFEQLQNLIHINYLKIQGIIFKDTGHIEVAAFTDLLNQLLVIPQLYSIGFLQSVLDEGSIQEFNFLIQEKKVKYLVLYKSFFLEDELRVFFKQKGPIKVNHNRFFILDMQAQKEYEFCPYTFNLDKKTEVEPFEIEKVFKLQSFYSKLIQEEINFYVGRNLSIITSTITDSITFKYSIRDLRSGNNQNQQEFEALIEKILKEDQFSILNIYIIKQLILLLRTEIEQTKFLNILKTCKSFKCYYSEIPESLLTEKEYSLGKFLSIYSSLRGFSRYKILKENELLSLDFRKINKINENQKYQEKFLEQDRKRFSQSTLNKLESSEYQSDFMVKEVIESINKLKKQTFQYYGSNKNKSYLTQLVKKLPNLQQLKISLKSDEQIKGVDFSGISLNLETFKFDGTDQIKDFSLISEILQKSPNLKQLTLSIDNYILNKSINFEYLSNSLQSLSLSKLRILSESTLNDIFNQVNQLKSLKMYEIEFDSDCFQRILFPNTITLLLINQIKGLNITDILEKFGKNEEFKIQDLEMIVNGNETKQQSQLVISQFLEPGSLQGLAQIKKLKLSYKFQDPEFLKMILINTPKIEEIEMSKFEITTFDGSWLEERAISLRKIKLDNFKKFKDGKSMFRVLQSAIILEQFDFRWQFSDIAQYSQQDIPNTIQKISFFETFFSDPFSIYNLFFQKCSQLKKFHHQNIYHKNFDNNKFEELNFEKISSRLKTIIFNIKLINPLGSAKFINQILQQCQEIEELTIPFLSEESLLGVNFSILGRQLKVINLCESKNNKLEKWIWMRNQKLFCIEDFEQNCLARQNGKEINYYEIIENPSIDSIMNQISQSIDSSLVQILNTPLKYNFEIKNTNYSKKQFFENPFYYYLLGRQFLEPVLNYELGLSSNIISHENIQFYKKFFLKKLIHQQSNIYKQKFLQKNSLHYQEFEKFELKDQHLQNEIKEKGTNSLEDQLIILVLDDSYKLDLILYLLNNCRNLRVLHFISDDIYDIQVRQEEVLVKKEYVKKFYFYTKYDGENYILIKMILDCCPNLEKLEFISDYPSFFEQNSFVNISEHLKKLQITEFKINEEQISQIFKRCQQLQILCFSSVELFSSSPQVFSMIPCTLVKIQIQNDSLSSEVVNQIVKRCQLLQNLDFQHSELDEKNQDKVSFEDISVNLKTICLFKIQDSFIQAKIMNQILTKCQYLTSIKFYSGECEPKADELLNKSNLVEEIIINSSEQQFSIVSKIIQNSTCFKKLQIRNVTDLININLTNLRIEPEELSIYNCSEESMELILDFISFQKMRKCFFERQTITSKFLNKITNSQNLKIFILQECEIEIDLSFINELFEQAKYLEIFSLISCKLILQNSFKSINFKLTPSSLKEFSLYSIRLEDFSFISDMLFATSKSLKCLCLHGCLLDSNKFEQIEFQNAGKSLEIIILDGNPDIGSLKPLRRFFEKGEDYRLKYFGYQGSNLEFESAELLIEFNSQIDLVNSTTSIYFQLNKFETKFEFSINGYEFIKFMKDQKGTSPIQKAWRQSNKRKFLKLIFQSFWGSNSKKLRQMKFQFLFLLTQVKMKPKITSILNNKLFILSPESLFNQVAYLKDTKNMIETEFSSSLIDEINSESLWNSFYIGFIGLDILSKKNFKYIFGYNKQKFEVDFPEFYDLLFTNQEKKLDFIKKFYNSIRKDGVERAFLPISFDMTEELLKEKKMNELEALILINTIPPSSISLSGMSIQFVKSWYAINFSSPLSVSTIIKIDYELIENSSISNFLSLIAYKLYIINFNPNSIIGKIKKIVGLISYSFFKMFSAPAKQYRFDHTIIHLENYIRSFYGKGLNHLLTALYLTQLFVCVFAVWFFQLEQNVGCGESMLIQTYIVYGIFGVITFCVEAVIFSKCLKFVSHLIPDIQPNCRVNFPNPIINRIKQYIIEIKWINRWYVNYLLSFINSQLSRLDFLTNIGFLYSAYTCRDDTIFLLTLLSLLIVNLTYIVIFISNLIVKEKKKAMITHHIDQLYQISSLLSFQSVAVLLDLISPTNSIILFNKMFNQRIIQSLIRNIIQDIPLILLKTLFLLQHKQEESSSIYPIISSGLMFISSLTQFLSVTPSIIGQGDFNKLCEFKKSSVLPRYLKNLEEYEQYMINSNLNEEMKCIKSETYRRKVSQATSKSIEDKEFEDDQKDIFENLRIIIPNIKIMKEIFGNSIIVNDSHSQSPLNSPYKEQESDDNFSNKFKGVHDSEEKKGFLEGSEIQLQKTPSFQINLNLNSEKND